MEFIESVKNYYAYLVQGRCRKHGRNLITVEVEGHCASTMPVCVECHPHFKGRVVLEPSHTTTTSSPLTLEPFPATAPELAEVEVG